MEMLADYPKIRIIDVYTSIHLKEENLCLAIYLLLNLFQKDIQIKLPIKFLDAVLDEILKQDPKARVACETLCQNRDGVGRW